MSCGMLEEQDDLTMGESGTQTGKEEHGGEAVRETMGRNMGGLHKCDKCKGQGRNVYLKSFFMRDHAFF